MQIKKTIKDFNIFSKIFFVVLAFSIIFSSIPASYASDSGDLVIYLKTTKGDRISAYGAVLKIYDTNNKPIATIEPDKDYQFFTTTLQKNIQYKIEAYVHDIYAATDYVKLTSDSQRMDLLTPLTGGIKFEVVYNDKKTPIQDATVVLKTHTGKQIRAEKTDMDGNTLRMWVPPTILDGDYYEAEVKLSDNITYSEKPISVLPSAQDDYKIVTPWPRIIDSLVSFTVFNNESGKVDSSGAGVVAKLYQNEKKMAESKLNQRSEVYFSNIPVGDYSIEIIRVGNSEPLIKKSISIVGDKLQFNLYANEINTKTTLVSTSQTNLQELQSCKCVAFRLDDVQDFWLNDVQIQIMKTFTEKQAPLTIGIIGGLIADDTKLISYLDDAIYSNDIEVANHGWLHEDFTLYDKAKQETLLKKTNQKIYELFKITPTVFIPPLNNFNSDTIIVLKENKMTHFSSDFDYSKPPYKLSNHDLYNFPEGAFTGDLNPQKTLFIGVSHAVTLDQIQQSLDKYGFAVVTIHPQEFSVIRDGTYTNSVNWTQIGELQKLIDKLQEKKLRIVSLSKINIDSEIEIPDWIRSNAKNWSEQKINDANFSEGIQFLIEKGMILGNHSDQSTIIIPVWFKNNAKWWGNNQISDDEFLSGIQYLLDKRIIEI